jgi:hypothetical protein
LIVREYRHDEPAEQSFVMTSFGLRTGAGVDHLRDLLKAGAKVLVAQAPTAKRKDGTPILYGWAAQFEDALVHAYVVHDYRKFPVVPSLIEALGFDTTKPITVLFDSAGMRAIARANKWTFQSPEPQQEIPNE